MALCISSLGNFFKFRQSKNELCKKNLKRFLYLSSSLNISGIDVTVHSHLIDIEYKKLIKADANKSTSLAKKETASSSSEALTSMGFLTSSYYNIFGSLITDLRQDMLKGNNKYPRTFTSVYYMLTRF